MNVDNMKAEDFLRGGEHRTVYKILNGHAKRKIKLNAGNVRALMLKMTEAVTKGHF